MTIGSESIHVLLVEDDEIDAELSLRALADRPESGSIDHVASLLGALEHLNRGRYDCVLLDLGLPDASGLAACDAITAHPSNTPVVVLTGSDDLDTAREAMHRGAQDYLVKGSSGAEIARALRFAVMRHLSELHYVDVQERVAAIEQAAVAEHAAIADPSIASPLPMLTIADEVDRALERLELALERANAAVAELRGSPPAVPSASR
ncbi:MAG: response regulator [Actinomycetota bacterium]